MLRNSSAMAKTILSISRDQLLLETRGAILRKSGHRVISVRSIEDFADAVREEEISLVVIGHTLPGQDRDDAYRIMDAEQCIAPVIELYATAVPPRSEAQFQLAVHDRSFQADLLALVGQVLSDEVN